MDINTNISPDAPTPEVLVSTKLKFTKSPKTGAWIGFASRNTLTGRIMGVRQDDPVPKDICVCAHELSPYIDKSVLYNVSMVRMKDKDGYIVVIAEPVSFRAVVESYIVKNAVYKVEVKFGNKIILYDPKDGDKSTVKNIKGVLSELRSRKDIANYLQVEADFLRAANLVEASLRQDGYYGQRKIQA